MCDDTLLRAAITHVQFLLMRGWKAASIPNPNDAPLSTEVPSAYLFNACDNVTPKLLNTESLVPFCPL